MRSIKYSISNPKINKEDRIMHAVASSLMVTIVSWGLAKLMPETDNTTIKLLYLIGEIIVMTLLIKGIIIFMNERDQNHKTKTYKKVNEME